MFGTKCLSDPGKRPIFLAIAVLALALSGCAGVNPAISPEQMASDTFSEHPLAPGDVIDVKFLYNPELNDSPRIRPDGTVQLALIGDLKVAGKTPEQLQTELVRLYTTELKNPKVMVTAKASRNNKIYVGGEVNKPGEIEMPGRMTAFEAINQAGGFKMDTAQVKTVMLIRSKEGRNYGTALNFKDSLEGKESQTVYLRPGDVIFVPATNIAKANLWIDQHINKMIPRVPVSLSAMP